MSERLTFTRLQPLRVGLEIGSAVDGQLLLRAVGVRRRETVWQRTAAVGPDESLEGGLAGIIRSLPVRRFGPRPEITVALGPSLTQIKRLLRLPAITDPATVTALVRTNAARFFLRNGAPLATSLVRISTAGDVWCAATEQPTLTAIETACRDGGFRLRAIVPTVTILGASFDRLHGPVTQQYVRGILWHDGRWEFALTYDGSGLTDIRRTPRMPDASDHGSPNLGDEGVATPSGRGAAAAALWRKTLPMTWTIEHRDRRAVSSSRRVAACAGIVVTSLFALLAPGLSASLAARTASRDLRAAAGRQAAARATTDSLTAVTEALNEVSAFASARRPATRALAELTLVLPAQAAITAYRVDTAGGSLLALAPHASELVRALEQDNDLTGIEIVGAVIQEPGSAATIAGGRTGSPLERMTVRFRWRAR